MSRRRHDDGFTLVETLTSIALISVVMAALIPFWLKVTAASAQQLQNQAANQIASAALERAARLPGPAILSGRPLCLMQEQWAPTSSSTPAVPAGVSVFLNQMTPSGDPGLSDFGCAGGSALTDQLEDAAADQPVPTRAVTAVAVGQSVLNFTTDTFIGTCWLNRSTPAAPNPGTSCSEPTQPAIPAAKLPMLRVVVAVTWGSNQCPESGTTGVRTCTQLAETLINPTLADLTFS